MSHLKKLYQEFSCSKLSSQIVVCLCGLFILGIITPAKAISNSYTGVNKIQNTDSITNLLTQRKELIQQNKSTIEIDKKLLEYSHLTVVLVSRQVNQESIVLTFEFFQDVSQGQANQFTSRLRQMFPELQQIDMDVNTHIAQAEFLKNVSDEKLNSFFKNFRYSGYEFK